MTQLPKKSFCPSMHKVGDETNLHQWNEVSSEEGTASLRSCQFWPIDALISGVGILLLYIMVQEFSFFSYIWLLAAYMQHTSITKQAHWSTPPWIQQSASSRWACYNLLLMIRLLLIINRNESRDEHY